MSESSVGAPAVGCCPELVHCLDRPLVERTCTGAVLLDVDRVRTLIRHVFGGVWDYWRDSMNGRDLERSDVRALSGIAYELELEVRALKRVTESVLIGEEVSDE